MTGFDLSRHDRAVRVFISSTFRDMMPERECLLKQVFPALRSLCRERHIQMTEVDLRWGITDEEAAEGRVIDICLEEIDRSRPYFIGILGDRYGWVPDAEEVRRRARLLEAYPWLLGDLETGLSITDIEMQYGVLRNPELSGSAFFFIRAGADAAPGSTDGDRLAALKAQIRGQSLFPFAEYHTPEELGARAFEALKAVIDRDFPPAETPTPLERDRLEHIAFIRSRTAVYVPDERMMALLDAHAAAVGEPLAVGGGSGTGKSALLANWLARRQEHDPSRFMLYHFCACNAESQSPEHMVTRLLEELKAHFAIPDAIPSGYLAQCEALPVFLAQSGGEGDWVLAIDALDRLSGEHSLSSWLPPSFPAFVKVVFTAADGPCLLSLAERGCRVVEVPVLDAEKRERLVEDYLSRYRKKLDPALQAAIAAAPLAENPLVLRTLLDELRLFGLHEGLGAQVRDYLAAESCEAFFEKVLERLELDAGQGDLVRDVLCAIACSAKGMAEHELIELFGITRLSLSRLLHALEHHLFASGGLLVFSHAFMESAVRRRYLRGRSEQRAWHRRLAAYFLAKGGTGPRERDEVPWQLARAGDLRALRDYLSREAVFALFWRDAPYDLCRFWSELSGRYSVRAALQKMFRTGEAARSGDEKAALAQAAGGFLQLFADYRGALGFFSRALRFCRQKYGEGDTRTAEAYTRVAALYDTLNDYDRSLKNAGRSLAIWERAGGGHAERAKNLNLRSNALWHRGEFEAALETNRRGLALCLEHLGELHPQTAETYRELAWDYEALSRYRRAAECHQKAVAINQRLFGENHPKTADSMIDAAWEYDYLGDYSEVMRLSQRSYDICATVYGLRHPETGRACKLLGMAWYRRGDYAKSLAFNEQFYRIAADAYGELHTRTAAARFQVGLSLLKLGQPDRAVAAFRESLDTDRAVMGEGMASDLAINYNYIGWGCALAGALADGEEALRRGREEALRFFGEHSNDMAENHYFFGILYDKMARFDDSLAEHRAALQLRTEIYGDNHPDTGLSHLELARVLEKTGQGEEAAPHRQRAEAIFRGADVLFLLEE